MHEPIIFHNATFLTSANDMSQLPQDRAKEIAFVGRSNCGKSSAINAITGQHKLAKTSKTPGRTQLLNFFVLSKQYRLVDLPGYGYAQVAIKTKQHWQQLMTDYISQRDNLCGLVILMDIRHPLQESDWQMLELANYSKLTVHIVLTKADKLSASQCITTSKQVAQELTQYPHSITLQLLSTLKKQGIHELQQHITTMLSS